MGDVFNALSRRREEAKPTGPSAPASQAPTATPARSDDTTPALPLDQVHATPMTREEAERPAPFGGLLPTAPAGPDSPAPKPGAAGGSGPDSDAALVANAAQRSAEEHPGISPVIRSPADAKLNGYSVDIVVHHDRGSAVTEQYRAIRTQVLARCRNRKLQTFVITSSAPEEGKSVSTINLGMTFSELRNKRTLLIEADLRRPSYGGYFGRDLVPGLAQYLRGEAAEIRDVIHSTVYDNLQILPGGAVEGQHSTELLSSPRMVQLLDRLKDHYDFIFIDSPPVVTVTDACILGAMVDQVLLVVRLNKTPSDVIERAKRLLRAANCDLAGVILTHLTYEMPRYLYRYDRYGYGANYSSTSTK